MFTKVPPYLVKESGTYSYLPCTLKSHKSWVIYFNCDYQCYFHFVINSIHCTIFFFSLNTFILFVIIIFMSQTDYQLLGLSPRVWYHQVNINFICFSLTDLPKHHLYLFLLDWHATLISSWSNLLLRVLKEMFMIFFACLIYYFIFFSKQNILSN